MSIDPRYAEGANFPPDPDCCETPPDFYARLHAEFNFNCDVFASADNAKSLWFFSTERSAFEREWRAGTFSNHDHIPLRPFANPPYSSSILGRAVRRMADQSRTHGCTVVGLVPPSTDAAWWHEAVMPFASEVRFVRGRLAFCYRGKPITTLDTKTGKVRKGSNRGSSAVLIFRPGIYGPVFRSMDA